MFFNLARRWRGLMITWMENEEMFLKKPYLIKQKLTLRAKLYFVTYSLLLLALVEHLLAKVSQFHQFEREIRFCNFTVDSRIEYYSNRDFRHYFQLMPYNPVLAVFFYVSLYTRSRLYTVKFTETQIISWLYGTRYANRCRLNEFFFQMHSAWLTFTWNFLDIFIVIVSVGILERFEQLNDYLFDVYSNHILQVNCLCQ